ncbi:hypothetical protein SDC9_102464 [bioreactor metagenome]|uniref:Flagellar motor switch protein FliN n=1 Tax=bioreactor metagenome TaxID=1076179 RepID=A0A645ARI6_9ZZZZ
MATAVNKPLSAADCELNSLEKDTIGEILNISMGAAATAISTMLDLKVEITTPVVSLISAGEFECKSLEPAIGTEIEYVEGLSGSNIMVMKQRDIRAIVNVLLGDDTDIDSDAPLDEMHLSAAGEIMNQMMGASSTALTSFLEKSINISTPSQFDVSKISQKVSSSPDECIVTVRFLLKIDSLLASEFVTVMPMGFTKELVASALGAEEQAEAAQEPPAPAPTPAPAPAPKPAAAPAPRPSESPKPKQVTPLSAPVNVQPVRLQDFGDEKGMDGETDATNLSLVMGVPLEVSAEIGRTRMSVKEILEIRQGSLIELDRQAGDPADILVNGQLIARGDIVIIDDDFGVRITEILSDRTKLWDK